MHIGIDGTLSRPLPAPFLEAPVESGQYARRANTQVPTIITVQQRAGIVDTPYSDTLPETSVDPFKTDLINGRRLPPRNRLHLAGIRYSALV